MGREFSAGVILFRKRSERQYLVLDYGSHWDFAKGHVEAGEAAEATARRELAEETGISDARFVPGFLEEMRYFYRRGGQLIAKTVTYFLAETEAEDVTISEEHRGFAWLSLREAQARVTFRTARELLDAADRFLESRAGSRREE
jgi:8-oxo-dGTP pyrophosphatase MutT (NUDIX family)